MFYGNFSPLDLHSFLPEVMEKFQPPPLPLPLIWHVLGMYLEFWGGGGEIGLFYVHNNHHTQFMCSSEIKGDQ